MLFALAAPTSNSSIPSVRAKNCNQSLIRLKLNLPCLISHPRLSINAKVMITYDEFKKVELKIGEVKEVSRVEGSEKLLKLTVEIGEPVPRQIIAGIGKVYEPEAL